MKDDLTTSAHALGATGARLSADVAGAATQAGQLIRDASLQQYELARSAVNDAQDAVSKRARVFAGDADGFVRQYPWKSIGLAALAGAVVALLFTRA